jgi:hypothetical protein
VPDTTRAAALLVAVALVTAELDAVEVDSAALLAGADEREVIGALVGMLARVLLAWSPGAPVTDAALRRLGLHSAQREAANDL